MGSTESVFNAFGGFAKGEGGGLETTIRVVIEIKKTGMQLRITSKDIQISGGIIVKIGHPIQSFIDL